jgi:nucleotide-binding universal stress UspA family protein
MVPYVDVVCLSFIRSISMFHKIMVAYDESSEAGRALQASIELAKTLGAELTVVTVLEPLPGYYSFAVSSVPAWNWTEEKRIRYGTLQAEARQQAKAAGVVFDAELINGDEVNTIVECAKRHHSDLLVLGMRKHSWLMTGHTSQDVAELAPCAVLGIK